jgi:toxin-antitoxin system PIN domain toxin
VIVPDANLLLYAYDATSPFHAKSASWWSACLSGSEPVGLCPTVIFSFVRIGTSPRAFAEPFTVDEACAHVETWLRQPVVQVVELDAVDVETTLALLRAAGSGGNLTTDAQVAAIALRNGAVVHTADSDFARFPKVRWHNPIRG